MLLLLCPQCTRKSKTAFNTIDKIAIENYNIKKAIQVKDTLHGKRYLDICAFGSSHEDVPIPGHNISGTKNNLLGTGHEYPLSLLSEAAKKATSITVSE